MLVSDFSFSPASAWEVASHCSYCLHFPNNWWCWASFQEFLPIFIHLWRNVDSNPLPIKKNRLLIFMLLSLRVSHIFSNPLPYVRCANVFSFCGSSIPVLDGIFCSMQVLFSSIYLFFLYALCFGVTLKKPLPNPRSHRISCIIYCKSFIVVSLKFRSLCHFELFLNIYYY